jgi:hypothetical protein
MSCTSRQESQSKLYLVLQYKGLIIPCHVLQYERVNITCILFSADLYLVKWNLRKLKPSFICKLVLMIYRNLFPMSQIKDVLVVLLKLRHLFWERTETVDSIIVQSLKTRWLVWIPSTIKWLTLYSNKQSQSLYSDYGINVLKFKFIRVIWGRCSYRKVNRIIRHYEIQPRNAVYGNNPVCCQIYTNRTNTLWGQNVHCLMLEQVMIIFTAMH